ncbi:hypothetical protein, partial [Parabacteroides merdae]|uniref:hypothetical protein n=1 Tax=Parabacteroides merdae TaxID=46503 RepID=UPI0039089E5B
HFPQSVSPWANASALANAKSDSGTSFYSDCNSSRQPLLLLLKVLLQVYAFSFSYFVLSFLIQ